MGLRRGSRFQCAPGFVGFLRRKLEDGGRPRLVHNVRGVGYVLRAAP